MSAQVIEGFYQNHNELYKYLLEHNQLSFAVDLASNFRRTLILAIASYFEHEVSTIVRALADCYADGHPFIVGVIEKKVISRQYHTYFDWDRPTANPFFSLFGEEFKSTCQQKLRDDSALSDAARAFLLLGQTRNLLVHQNYIEFAVDLTPDDIMDRFHRALNFVEFIRSNLIKAKPSHPQTTVI